VTNVLAPVVAEAGNDVASVGAIAMREASNPPKIMHEVTIAMHGKPPSRLAFLVDENGAVHSYKDGSSANTMGNVTAVNQVQIRQVLSQALEAIGRT
jgi:hypothetical protein